MKKENVIYGIGSALVISGAFMKIFHMPYGNEILLSSLIGMAIFQSWYVIQFKKVAK